MITLIQASVWVTLAEAESEALCCGSGWHCEASRRQASETFAAAQGGTVLHFRLMPIVGVRVRF